jgi:hypothetical protein
MKQGYDGWIPRSRLRPLVVYIGSLRPVACLAGRRMRHVI